MASTLPRVPGRQPVSRIAWIGLSAVLMLPVINRVELSAQSGPPAGLPPQAALQAVAQFDGELDVQIEDYAGGSRTLHFLNTSNGRLKLDIPGEPPGLPSGTRVRVHGRMTDASTLALGSSKDVQTLALAVPNTLGEQRVAVFLINFQDNTSAPYSPTQAYSTTFQTVSNFYLENSHSQTWLTGDVFGWYTLPMSSSTCDTNQMATLAEQAATSAGVNVSNYPRRIFAFPQIGACSWWGLGSVGGNPSRAWVNGSYALKVVAHEFGHNLGDYHSRSLPCTSGSCSAVEYGDDGDVMGNPTSGHMNAFQKERLGWLNYGDSPAVQTVTQSNAYRIGAYAAIDSTGTTPKALKILKSTDSAGYRTWYYVEARTQTGFDAGVSPGVIVHTGSESTGNSSYEVDLDPVGSGFDSRLNVGQSFTDATAGVTIAVLSSDSTGAMIDVSVVAAPCAAQAPGVSVTPSGSILAQAGMPASLSVTVTNNDDAGCGASSFDLQALAPTGWSAVFSPSGVSLNPGASVTASLTVTPPMSATGSADVQVGAYRSSGSSASTVASFQIVSGLDVAVSVKTARSSYTLSAAVTAGGGPVAGASVAFAVTDPSGGTRTLTATTGSNGVASVSYKPGRKAASGTYTVVATATLGSLTGSGAVQFLK